MRSAPVQSSILILMKVDACSSLTNTLAVRARTRCTLLMFFSRFSLLTRADDGSDDDLIVADDFMHVDDSPEFVDAPENGMNGQFDNDNEEPQER
jgi:hypothetical protein